MRGMFAALSFAALLAAPALAAAQTIANDPQPSDPRPNDPRPNDPWEQLNRDLFAVHEGVDKAVLEPVARGYRAITPSPVRTGVLNFLHNLRSPIIFTNDVLQGELARAGVTAARFGLNTTIGVAGILDPARSLGLARHDEDFGQTLAVWGVAAGPYLFVPVLGPTTIRDGAGRIIDIAFDPLTWAKFDEADEARIGRTAVSGVAARETVLDAVDDLRRDSLDPYVSIRSSYGLLRQSAIRNGPASADELPDFSEIFDEPAPGEPADNPPAIQQPAADVIAQSPSLSSPTPGVQQ